jgi:hypothetical protein
MPSQDAQHLIYFLAERDKEKRADGQKPKISFSSSVGLFAFIYERVRNFVDYQEEHLLLRRAITRVLIRRTKTTVEPQKLIEELVGELLMARYLESGVLSEEKMTAAKTILEKYFLLYRHLGQRKLENGESLWDFLLSLAGREIEEIFVPSNEDLLINFALKKVEKRVAWSAPGSEEEKRTRLLIALMRALSKDEDRTIYFHLWQLYFPFWQKATEEEILLTARNFTEADSTIRGFLSEGQGEPLMRRLKKKIAPFEILRDLINQGFVEVEEVFSSPEKLAKAAEMAADRRYQRALFTLRRSAINSFIYIFITKMVFALAIEIPYELYVASHVNPLPILINLFFPPALMLFMALTVESPTKENTKRIVEEILAMTFGENGLSPIKIDFSASKSPLLTFLFRFLYGLAFLLTFGLMVYILGRLNFSLVSLAIFFFFLSSIAFFAFRIRSSFKELVVGEEGSNFVSTVFDFFMLPFVKVGRAISTGLREVNIFIFIFDIILEAPFKTLLEIIDEWRKFLRDKQEEALNVIK